MKTFSFCFPPIRSKKYPRFRPVEGETARQKAPYKRRPIRKFGTMSGNAAVRRPLISHFHKTVSLQSDFPLFFDFFVIFRPIYS